MKDRSMSGKFMRIKKLVVSTIVLVVMASQLAACAAAAPDELMQMYNNHQAVEIEIPVPADEEQGEELGLGWTQLDQQDNYAGFRKVFDDALKITRLGQGGKNGVIYVDLEGNWTGNSTLYNAFMNRRFVEGSWNDAETVKSVADGAREVFVDVESDHEALLAGYNAYFGLLADGEGGYANLYSTLTRGEFMEFMLRADTPVHEVTPDQAFLEAVGNGEHAAMAQEVSGTSYLQFSTGDLTSSTFSGTITRAEAVYALVQRYYKAEYDALTGQEKPDVPFTDAKDGGDIALKVGLAVESKDKETKEVSRSQQPGCASYELAYALRTPDDGLPTGLYKALVVASRHGLIGEETRWDEGLTKLEALEFTVKLFETLAKENGYRTDAERGASAGEVVEQEPQGGGEQSGGEEQQPGGEQAGGNEQSEGNGESSWRGPLTDEEKASGEYEELIPGVWVKKPDTGKDNDTDSGNTGSSGGSGSAGSSTGGEEQPSNKRPSTPEEFVAAGYVEVMPDLWLPKEDAIALGYITEDDVTDNQGGSGNTGSGNTSTPSTNQSGGTSQEDAGGADNTGGASNEDLDEYYYVPGDDTEDENAGLTLEEALQKLAESQGMEYSDDVPPTDPNAPDVPIY